MLGHHRQEIAKPPRSALPGDYLGDKGATGPIYLNHPEIAQLVVEALLDSDLRFQRCKLHAFVVMPNHVHLLATQLATVSNWPGPLKGFTANQAKKALGLSEASFWQNESYHRLVRNDDEFLRIQNYIELNPVRAGLVEKPENFRWSSAGTAGKGQQGR